MNQRIGKYGALLQVAVAASGVVLCLVLFFRTQPVELRRHNLLMHHLTQLQRDEALLGEEVMRLGFNLANDYDQMTAIAIRLRRTVRELKAEGEGGGLQNAPEFQNQLLLLEDRLATKFDASEKFKSTNSILKNSLIYLPHLRDELAQVLTPGQAVHERLDGLVELVLLQNNNSTSLEHRRLSDSIGKLESDLELLPAGKLKDQFKVLLHHAHLVLGLSKDLHALQEKLSSSENGEGLSKAYRHYYDQQVMRASQHRSLLLLVMFGLLGYSVFVIVRWREKAMLEQARSMKLAAAVFESQEGMVVTDANNVILRVNQAFTKITGYTAEEVLGQMPTLFKSGRHDKDFYAAMWRSIKNAGTWEGEIWNRRKNGEVYPERLTITAVKDEHGNIANFVATMRDITQSKAAEDEIRNLAFFDPLTRLPNRRLLMDRLQQALASCAQSGKKIALLFIDLDHFKTLNDTLGHDFGDLLLQQVAERISATLRKSDTVARIGGDEFVVILENLSKTSLEAAAETKAVGEKILTALNQPYQLGQHEYHSSPSIGITMIEDQQSSIDELLKQADIAMYQSKMSGRNALHFFDPKMQDAISVRVELEGELRRAIKAQQFQLHYQIQVDSAGRPLGAEALIRWQHPERGLIPPNDFIPIAEEGGLILPVGQWVLDAACAQLKAWQGLPLFRELVLAVNVSPKQFRQVNFVDQVQAAIVRNGVEGRLLKLELTESMLLDNIENTISTMNALKGLGIQLSLDDFGTGYSSLQYLKMLPLDQLKIDRSFVRDIAVDCNDKAIVQTIISMAQSMNLDVIAEGVEGEEQRQHLLNLGCKHFQGYFFGKPQPAADFEKSLGERSGSLLLVTEVL
jgi:diguanylate cyclase (GGDEF)-like protein/PAS domain S-box-containing protein